MNHPNLGTHSTSGGIMFSKLDKQIFASEFEFYCELNLYGLVNYY